MARGPLELLRSIVDILDRLGIRYALGGSMASSLVGEPRTTVDIDIAVELDDDGLNRLIVALGDSFYVPEEVARSAVQRHETFNAIDLVGGLKVDLFVLGDGILDRRQLDRRMEVRLPDDDLRIFVTSPEDQVLRKLDWYRLGGGMSDRQWRDVIGILRAGAARIDCRDLERTASEVGLEELLGAALRDAGLDERR